MCALEISQSARQPEDWTEPGVFEVSPGVYRVPLPLPLDGLRAVNVYLIVGVNGITAIDSGWAIPEARGLFLDALVALGAAPGDVRRFLITHIHGDHYQHAIALRREFGIQVELGIDERTNLEMVRSPDFTPARAQLRLLQSLGARELAERLLTESSDTLPDISNMEPPDRWMSAGRLELDDQRNIDIVSTPGHTRGHMVFHDLDARLLFAGDHILPTITPSIGFEESITPNPLGDFMRSLAIVRARPDAALLPAHGPVTRSVHGRVDELLAHHEERLKRAEEALVEGESTGLAVATRLTWTRRGRTLDELDPLNQLLAVVETGAHLDLLVFTGRASKTSRDGISIYSANPAFLPTVPSM